MLLSVLNHPRAHADRRPVGAPWASCKTHLQVATCARDCNGQHAPHRSCSIWDFQRDLTTWGIRALKGGVDAKELFHLYVVLWIQDKRLHLLDFCKFDKERCTWVTTQHSTSPFVEEVYERIKETLNEYEIIIHRWPEYTIPLEHAMADVERAVVAALEKQYADLLAPLKDLLVPKKFSLQYMQKLTRRQKPSIYSAPAQLGVMLNSIKRLLDTLRPKIAMQMKAWAELLPDGAGQGEAVFGERLF